MACSCKNQDGSLSDLCFGTCVDKIIMESDSVQIRSDKSIEDRFEYLLGMFINKIDNLIYRLELISDLKYKEDVRFGFDMAREIYE